MVWSRYCIEKENILYLARAELPRIKKDGTVSKQKSVQYQCAKCKKYFPSKEVQVDHIEPVGRGPKTLSEFSDWLTKLFVHFSRLQVLCKRCHSQKTKEDRKNV